MLVRLGMNYLVANALLVAVLTPVNYVLGHFWTFSVARGKTRMREPEEVPAQEYAVRVGSGKTNWSSQRPGELTRTPVRLAQDTALSRMVRTRITGCRAWPVPAQSPRTVP